MKKFSINMSLLLICSISFSQKMMEREQIKQEIKTEVEAQLNERADNQKINKLKNHLKLSGKGLIRVGEQDWNNETARNVYKNDRFWSRMNFYLQLDADLTKNISLTSRIRTGNQQYSFVTFGGNSEDRLSFMLDRMFLKYSNETYWITFGRNNPIWKSQKGAQFDIPTHDGIATGAKYVINKNTKIEPSLAFYTERYSGRGAETSGRMYGGQVLATNNNDATKLLGRIGFILSNNLQTNSNNSNAGRYENTATGKFYDGDLANDYSILSIGTSVSIKNMKNLTFAGDFYYNMKNYDINPVSYQIKKSMDGKYTPDFTNQKTGFIVTALVGNRGKKGDWQTGASYTYIEKYAAQDYFAQWDYARFAATNIKGPEIFATYQPFKNIEFRTRLFFTEEIKGYDGNDPSFRQNGNRVRFDINFKF